MRHAILLGALLAGCLGLADSAEARDRHGQRGGHGFAGQGHGQIFAQPSSLRLFAPRHHGTVFAPRRHSMGFAPRPHVRRFAHRHDGMRLDGRRHNRQFVERRPLPLSQQPGFRILAGRQILPFVRVPLARTFVVRPGKPRFPTFVRVFPRPAIPPHRDLFGIPRRHGGLTIIVRDPWASW